MTTEISSIALRSTPAVCLDLSSSRRGFPSLTKSVLCVPRVTAAVLAESRWGDSADSTNLTMCGTGPGSKTDYTNTRLGPLVRRASDQADLCARQLCNSRGTCWVPPPVGGEEGDGEDPPPAPVKLACDCDVGFEGEDCGKKKLGRV